MPVIASTCWILLGAMHFANPLGGGVSWMWLWAVLVIAFGLTYVLALLKTKDLAAGGLASEQPQTYADRCGLIRWCV